MNREIVEQPAGLSEALRAYFMQASPEVRLFAGLLDAQVLPRSQAADAPEPTANMAPEPTANVAPEPAAAEPEATRAEDGDQNAPEWARQRLLKPAKK